MICFPLLTTTKSERENSLVHFKVAMTLLSIIRTVKGKYTEKKGPVTITLSIKNQNRVNAVLDAL